MTGEISRAGSAMARFGASESGPPAGGPVWLRELREAGARRFAELGLPTPKTEDWKYTSLREIERSSFRGTESLPAAPSIDRLPSLLAERPEVFRLVFVNGRLHADLSRLDGLPAGVTLEALQAGLDREPAAIEAHLGRIGALGEQPLLALNTALMDDGPVLRIARGVALATPIEVVFVGGLADQPIAYHPRHLIALEEGSAATVVEHHLSLGDGDYLANAAAEISLGPGARLRHYKLQAEGAGGLHIATSHVRVGREATYESFALSTGARLSRNETRVRLEGEGAHCGLSGAYLMRGRQHWDTTTVIDHLVPHTSCREVFKGVLDDEARGVFQGRIEVHRGAQHADGHQLSKSLLLSEKAEIDAKPELRIYADDVKCSHGATAGALDEAALFYLRSRGIPERRARSLLVESFLGEALGEIAEEPVREALLVRVRSWLSDAASGGEHD